MATTTKTTTRTKTTINSQQVKDSSMQTGEQNKTSAPITYDKWAKDVFTLEELDAGWQVSTASKLQVVDMAGNPVQITPRCMFKSQERLAFDGRRQTVHNYDSSYDTEYNYKLAGKDLALDGCTDLLLRREMKGGKPTGRYVIVAGKKMIPNPNYKLSESGWATDKWQICEPNKPFGNFAKDVTLPMAEGKPGQLEVPSGARVTASSKATMQYKGDAVIKSAVYFYSNPTAIKTLPTTSFTRQKKGEKSDAEKFAKFVVAGIRDTYGDAGSEQVEKICRGAYGGVIKRVNEIETEKQRKRTERAQKTKANGDAQKAQADKAKADKEKAAKEKLDKMAEEFGNW